MTAPAWSLSATSDPVLLVPGSPAAVRADAIALNSQAATLRGAADTLEAGTRITTWTGEARDLWVTRRGELCGAPHSLADVFDAAATALRAHADVLAWAQARAMLAVRLWSGTAGAGVCVAPAPGRRSAAVVATGLATDQGSGEPERSTSE
ncbi:putative T7SS-secreted protein [Cellulomonas soli]